MSMERLLSALDASRIANDDVSIVNALKVAVDDLSLGVTSGSLGNIAALLELYMVARNITPALAINAALQQYEAALDQQWPINGITTITDVVETPLWSQDSVEDLHPSQIEPE